MRNYSTGQSPNLSLIKPPSEMEGEILEGLFQQQKTLPAKFLYDQRGTELFEKITELEEYYLTRAERSILQEFSEEISAMIGPDALVVEPGSGAGGKFRLLLPSLERLRAYVPIEISRSALENLLTVSRMEFPDLRVLPVCADYTRKMTLPETLEKGEHRRVIFFPGSSIGNLEQPGVVAFLKDAKALVREQGGLLVGLDLKKDPWTLLRAYDDSKGVTAEFNLNILGRLNRELGATFESQHFYHEAYYNERLGRIEMHLVSRLHQIVKVAGQVIRFHLGESIHTESSYKYTLSEFPELAKEAGWSLRRVWRDRNQLFAIFYFEVI